MLPDLKTITENFELLEDWDDRYRYLIELGKMLAPLPESAKTEENRVKGCASQVWVLTETDRSGAEPRLTFRGDSDAHIVKGLVALILTIYSGHTASDILKMDTLEIFSSLGLKDHLTPQRSNGVRSMVERIRRDAASV